MRDLLQPTTDAGNIAQLLLVVVLWAAAVTWTWRRSSEARLVAIGAGILAVGLLGLRAMH